MEKFQPYLEKYASELFAKFSLPVSFNPEDQLKIPVANLLENIGDLLNINIETLTEVQVDDLAGRPDIGATVNSLITGYIELKAPGKGANTARLKGADKKQWNKFKNLPNLIYSDGNEWALYRDGNRVGRIVKFSGDVTTDGADAIDTNNAKALFELLNDFMRWEPIVPSSSRGLAEILAPICRLLKEEVLTSLENPESNLSFLAADWRKYLFPEADDIQFADAYAQTLTYALLLAQFSGADSLSLSKAVKIIRPGHRLLADTLKILGDENAKDEIIVPVSLLERVIAAIDVQKLYRKTKGDPWLNFYEDFLAVYDPKMRNDRGVFFTPVPVVQAQVRLVSELLFQKFDAEFSFVDPKVITLDPAAGTGTYILTAIEHGLEQVSQIKGSGMRAQYASRAAENMHAFELLVGPYAVCHLRFTQQILGDGGKVPDDGVHVYLTDTLESPYEKPPELPLLYRPLGDEHIRAQKIKAETPVLVCIGNPPYDRQQISDESQEKRKGGWIRYGELGDGKIAPLRDFLKPLTEGGLGVHAKNLYNDYIYFWRWALWKVFDSTSSSGIVSFITASSYLRGPGFAGVRKVMRETFDDLWIIDLEGDNLGARKTENVFAIQTPVAIAIGVRYDKPQPEMPATIFYTRIDGTQEEKLATLTNINGFQDLEWRECLDGWQDVFLPGGDSDYWDWPLITDLFPWQENGMQFKRTWPIGECPAVLETRWKQLLSLPLTEQIKSFKETGARRINKIYPALDGTDKNLPAISKLKPDATPFQMTKYAFRSFDSHWVLRDNRLCDRPRPTLLYAHSEHQIYITSLITNVLGEGPAATATRLIPDLHHFRGSFGGKHVIPLWRDADATDSNLTSGVLEKMSRVYSQTTTAEDFFAYCYAVLASPEYTKKFWDELTIPGPRIPITKDVELFKQVVTMGRKLLWLHTYGERFVPNGQKVGRIPSGHARCKAGTPSTSADYPEEYSYSYSDQELRVGLGIFENVRPQIWEFNVSGFEVVKKWLGYRMRKRTGRSSSPLDKIRPEVWEFDVELLDLLWVLDHTIDLLPDMKRNLDLILASKLFVEDDFPQPTDLERRNASGLPLFDFEGIYNDVNND